MKKNILIVSADLSFTKELYQKLRCNDLFHVCHSYDKVKMLESFQKENCDLIILDSEIGGQEGWQALAVHMKAVKNIPILLAATNPGIHLIPIVDLIAGYIVASIEPPVLSGLIMEVLNDFKTDAVHGTDKYSIAQEGLKYGLRQNRRNDTYRITLQPAYTSIRISNLDVNLERLNFDKEAIDYALYRCIWEMWNLPIISVDGKQGLLYSRKILPGLKYDRVLKLTIFHYLCVSNNSCSLFYFNPHSPNREKNIEILEDFAFSDSLTLEFILHALKTRQTTVYCDLMKLLQKNGMGRYISQYRYYRGIIGSDCEFDVAIQRVIIDNNFNIKPLVVVKAVGSNSPDGFMQNVNENFPFLIYPQFK